jgi:cytochrome c5
LGQVSRLLQRLRANATQTPADRSVSRHEICQLCDLCIGLSPKKIGMQTAWPRRVAEARGRCNDVFGSGHAAPRRGSLGEIMRTKIQRLVLLVMLVGGLLVALSAPANAATNQISGVAVYDTTCPAPPAGYEDFNSIPPLRLTGSLEGCWYTNADTETAKDNGAPSGVYLESGEEIFVGSLNGGPVGTFSTTYKFESKWDPDVSTGSEVHGRCQHPIIGGTGGFEGVTGRVDIKDDVITGEFFYRGHIKL